MTTTSIIILTIILCITITGAILTAPEHQALFTDADPIINDEPEVTYQEWLSIKYMDLTSQQYHLELLISTAEYYRDVPVKEFDQLIEDLDTVQQQLDQLLVIHSTDDEDYLIECSMPKEYCDGNCNECDATPSYNNEGFIAVDEFDFDDVPF